MVSIHWLSYKVSVKKIGLTSSTFSSAMHMHKVYDMPNISEMTELREINLDSNKIQHIPDGIW